MPNQQQPKAPASAPAGKPKLTPRQAVEASFLFRVARKMGKWSPSLGGANYVPAKVNRRAAQGLACANCVMWQPGPPRGPGVAAPEVAPCAAVAVQAEQGGVCRLRVVPPEKVHEAGI